MGTRIEPEGGRAAKASLLYADVTRGSPTDPGGLQPSYFAFGVQLNYRFWSSDADSTRLIRSWNDCFGIPVTVL